MKEIHQVEFKTKKIQKTGHSCYKEERHRFLTNKSTMFAQKEDFLSKSSEYPVILDHPRVFKNSLPF